MPIHRREILQGGLRFSVAAGAGLVLGHEGGRLLAAPQQPDRRPPPAAFDKLKPLGERVKPITVDEMKARIAQVQKLMSDPKPPYAALFLAPGSGMYYFAGIRWGGGERLFGLTIPRKGEPFIVCPAFEEERARELLKWPIEVRVWQEDESPYALVVKGLADRGIRSGAVGVEEQTRFFFFDGLRKAGPGLQFVSGDPLTIGCRSRKTAHELELMSLANEATVDVLRAVFASMREGQTQREVAGLVSQGFQRMGLGGGGLVLFGEWAALPHGTTQPQRLAEGQVVLLDVGTSVEGYASDITRTGVLGKPSDKARRAFEVVRQSQEAAIAAAVRGRTCGSVDDAARKVVISNGYGKNYEIFTHRVGHGIGLDGHEHPYLVRGSKVELEPGMTFSDEPGIYVRGEYGVRLEDIMAISDDGPAKLLTPGLSNSLDKPCD
jgi:Xaa-Pro dipeptidase